MVAELLPLMVLDYHPNPINQPQKSLFFSFFFKVVLERVSIPVDFVVYF
jgi:hypothetical protein